MNDDGYNNDNPTIRSGLIELVFGVEIFHETFSQVHSISAFVRPFHIAGIGERALCVLCSGGSFFIPLCHVQGLVDVRGGSHYDDGV